MNLSEFDQFADEYYEQHREGIAASGEGPEYFHRCKIEDLAAICAALNVKPERVLDFGAGIGNSIPYMRAHLPGVRLTCADVSERSMELARKRFPGDESYIKIEDNRLPIADGSMDVVFSACVFHHIDHAEHIAWLTELRRVTRPGGLLFIYEHNPLNPLTQWVVNTCPFDENAHLISGPTFRGRVREAGWATAEVKYRIFFPRALASLRGAEKNLTWLPLGAQYFVAARKAAN